MATLTELPVETLLSVTSHLPTSDLSSLRLTCKSLEHSLFNFFATEFFTTRQIWMYPDSLEHLLAIARHPQLRERVQRIIVGLDSIEPSVRSNKQAVKDICDARDRMVETSEGADRLYEIFTQLPQLQCVQVRDFKGLHGRPRDGTPYRSYGVKTLQRFLDTQLNRSLEFVRPSDYDHGRSIVTAVYKSVLKAGLTLKTLEVITRENASALYWENLHIKREDLTTYAPVLGSWTTLMLCLIAYGSGDCKAPTGSLLAPETFGPNFLDLCPNLTHLRINLGVWPVVPGRADRFVTAILHAARSLTKLRVLEFGKAELREEYLVGLLLALSPTLENFGLQHISLRSDGWEGVLDALAACEKLTTARFARCIHVWWKPDAAVALKYHKKANVLWPAHMTQKLEGSTHEALMQDMHARAVLITDEVLAEHAVTPGRRPDVLSHEPHWHNSSEDSSSGDFDDDLDDDDSDSDDESDYGNAGGYEAYNDDSDDSSDISEDDGSD